MLRRTLLKKSKDKEKTQSRALFRINCNCKGKICKVLIDSSSTDNMVSSKMVDKLKLQIFPHQAPYRDS